MRRLVLPAAALFLATACLEPAEPPRRLTEAEAAELLGAADAAEEAGQATTTARRAAVRTWLGAPVEPTGDACPIPAADVVGTWDPEDLVPAPSTKLQGMMQRVTEIWMDGDGPLQPDEAPAPKALVGPLARVRFAAQQRDPLPPEVSAETYRAELDDAVLPYTLTFVVDGLTRAKVAPDDTFTPGDVKGRLLLWDTEARRHLCAASVQMASLPQARAVFDPNTGLPREGAVSARLLMDLISTAVVLGTEQLKAFPAED